MRYCSRVDLIYLCQTKSKILFKMLIFLLYHLKQFNMSRFNTMLPKQPWRIWAKFTGTKPQQDKCGAVVMRYNISWYYTQYCSHSSRKQIIPWTHQIHSIYRPHARINDVLIVRNFEKNDRVITAWYCNEQTCEQFWRIWWEGSEAQGCHKIISFSEIITYCLARRT